MHGRDVIALAALGIAGAATIAAAAASSPAGGRFKKRLTGVRLTRYWLAKLKPGDTALLGETGTVLAWVSAESLAELLMEGTGVLPDGRRVNYMDGTRWRLLPSDVWGLGVGGRKLVPFESIAVDPHVIPYDSLCYLPELRRWVKAVDTGDLITGNHIDLFIGPQGSATGDDARDWCTVDVYA